MTDLESFQEFFDRMGVPYETDIGIELYSPDGVPGTDRIVIAKSSMCFSIEGTFLGVVDHDYCEWEPRETE